MMFFNRLISLLVHKSDQLCKYELSWPVKVVLVTHAQTKPGLRRSLPCIMATTTGYN